MINGKYYIGVHKSKLENDSYFGSGKRLKYAIKKYGKENFKKEILEYFENSEQMYLREKQIITEEFLKNENVYNIRLGGFGGFEFINQNKLNDRTGYRFSEEQKILISKNRKAAVTEKHRKDISLRMKNKRHGLGVSGGKTVTCPWCNKIGYQNGMSRYHFDKCKMRA